MPPWVSRLTRFVGPAGAFVFGLWLTSRAWGPLPPAGDDLLALAVRADEGARVLGDFHLDGWSPRFLNGFPVFLHYGPGLSVAYLLVKIATFGALSSVGAIQVLCAVSFAAVAPAAWFLARSLKLNETAATIAAFLVLGVNSEFGVGLASIYSIGLLTHAVAAPFVLVALGAALRSVHDRDDRRWPIVLALALVVVILTHVLSTLIAALLLAVLIALALPSLSGWTERLHAIRRVALGGGAALALTAFWIIPYFAYRDERGYLTAWSTPSLRARLVDILSGRFLFKPFVIVFVIAGWAWAVLEMRRGRRLPVCAPIAAAVFAVFAHRFYSMAPSNDIAISLANRGFGYAGVLAMLPAAGFIAEVVSGVRSLWARTGLGVAVAALVLIVVPGAPGLRDIPRQQLEPAPQLVAVAEELRRVVPDGARFATERNLPIEFGQLHVAHADFWLAQRSGKNTANLFNIELSPTSASGGLAENLLNDASGSITAARFAKFGVTHLVTTEAGARDRLIAAGDVTEILRAEPLSLLAVRPKGLPNPASLLGAPGPVSARLVRISDDSEHMTISTRAQENSQATVAVGWSSSWRVRIDGERVPIVKSAEGLVEFTLPRGSHRVQVDWHRDRLPYLGLLIAVLAVGGLVWWWRREEVRLRLEDAAAAEVQPVQEEAAHHAESGHAVADVGPHRR